MELKTVATIKAVNETNPDKTTFWGIETTDGNKYTVWDENIKNTLQQSLGQVVGLTIKVAGNFQNIRGVELVGGQTTMTETKPIVTVPTTPKTAEMLEKANTAQPTREATIIAQCLTKCVANSNDKMTSNMVWETYQGFLKRFLNG